MNGGAHGWRTVRVFISSTFKDMQAERDHLVRFVFPRLREELLPRRVRLVDVDLRWGVTTDQDALEVCREVIDECRPRFLCILGGRYGWTPLPPAVEEDCADQLDAGSRSLLQQAYHHEARVYRLRSDPVMAAAWGDDREANQKALLAALEAVGVPGAGHSITADEVKHALDDPLQAYRFFCFRDPKATASVPEEKAAEYREPTGSEAEGKLAALKDHVCDAGFEPFVYSARWDHEQGRLVDLEAFGERVYADLLWSVDDELGTEAPEALHEFAEEAAAMEAFVEERVERYVVGSRQGLLDELADFAQGDGQATILALTGPPGSGKSALLAVLCRHQQADHPEALIIPHFVGVSAGSADLRRTLRRLCHELGDADPPQEIRELTTRFAERLGQAAATRRVVLVLDAVNQLDPSDNAHSMYWLPRPLPEGVRLIVSSLEHPALEAVRARGDEVRDATLEPLTADDGRAIIDEFLRRYRKRMDDAQVAALLAKPESGNPLYLLVALEELRTLGIYERITRDIVDLPDDVRSLFLWVLRDRLSKDPGFRDTDGRPIGTNLVRRFVSLLGVSRHGLSEQELAELIAPGDPPDALGNVAALERLLRPYLMRRNELVDFYHTQLREAVEAEYLDEEQERLDAHRALAAYFGGQPHRLGDPQEGVPNARKCAELPWQLREASEWEGLYDLLRDADFFSAAWDHDDQDVRTHWAQMEVDSDLRMVQAYLPDLGTPRTYDREYLRRLAALFTQRGDQPAALILWTYAGEKYEWARHPLGQACEDEVMRIVAGLSPEGAEIAMERLGESLERWRGVGYEKGVQDVRLKQAQVLINAGDVDGAMAVLSEVEETARQGAPHSEALAASLTTQGLVLAGRGETARANELHQEAERICRDGGHTDRLAVCLSARAGILVKEGNLEDARCLLTQAEHTLRQLGELPQLSACLMEQADLFEAEGEHSRAAETLAEAAAIFRRLARRDLLLGCLGRRVQMLQARGRTEDALAVLKEAEEVCRESDDKEALQACIGNQACILDAAGQPEKAMPLYEQQAAVCREFGNKHGLAEALGNMAAVLSDRGEYRRAMELHREEVGLCRELDDPPRLARCLANKAALLLRRGGSARKALACAEEASRITQDHGLAEFASRVESVVHWARREAAPKALLRAALYPLGLGLLLLVMGVLCFAWKPYGWIPGVLLVSHGSLLLAPLGLRRAPSLFRAIAVHLLAFAYGLLLVWVGAAVFAWRPWGRVFGPLLIGYGGLLLAVLAVYAIRTRPVRCHVCGRRAVVFGDGGGVFCPVCQDRLDSRW